MLTAAPSGAVTNSGFDSSSRPGSTALLAGSAWLVATTGVVAITGFLFWLLAAHTRSQGTVGHASALYSAVLFVTYATNMGLPIAVARYAPDRTPAANVIFSWSILYSIATSVIGAIVLATVGPHSLLQPALHWGRLGGTVLLAGFATALALSALMDIRMMTVGLWHWVLVRAALAGIVRLGLVVLRPSLDDALWVLVSLAASAGVSAVLGAVLLHRATPEGFRLSPRPSNSGAAFRYANVNYLAQLAVQAPFLALPVVVAVHVSAAMYGSFYVAWSIASIIFAVPQVVGLALLVEGGKRGARLDSQARQVATVTVAFALLAAAGATAASRVVTAIYGHAYVQTARLLPVLILPAAAWAITSTCLAHARVRHDGRATIAITTVFAAGVLAPALFWVSRSGAHGAAAAWVVGHLLAAATGLLSLRRQRAKVAVARVASPAAFGGG